MKVGNRFSPLAVVRIVVNPLVALPEYRHRYGEPVGYDWRITTLMQFTFLLPVLTAVAFVFLPFSMRRCRVRRKHLIRIACFSLCGNFLILSAVYAAPGWLGTYGNFHAHTVMDVCRQGPITIAWSAWFWASAAQFYLRMPHGWGVSLALHFIACSLIVLNPFMLLTLGSYM